MIDEEVEKICGYARAQIGTLYALPEAITIRARSILRMPETRKLFCSRLVAKSYKAAGISLANLRNPAYCTPKQLGLCKAFYRVSDAIRKATEEEIAFEDSPDPNIYHQNQTYEWLNKVRSLTLEDESTIEVDIQSLNDVNDLLLKFPQCDKIISSFVKKSGYLSFYEYDIRTNPYRYDDKLFQIAMRHHPDPISFIDDLLEIEANLFPIYAQNLEGFISYAKQQNLEFFRIHIELYTNLIRQLHCRLKAVISFHEAIQDLETVRDLARLDKIVIKGITTGEEALIALKLS